MDGKRGNYQQKMRRTDVERREETRGETGGGQEAGRLRFTQSAEGISNMASSVCVWQMAGG